MDICVCKKKKKSLVGGLIQYYITYNTINTTAIITAANINTTTTDTITILSYCGTYVAF